MNLRGLIVRLQELESKHGGDVEMFANGEHGEEVPLTGDMVSDGAAEILIDLDNNNVDADQFIIHIGGY